MELNLNYYFNNYQQNEIMNQLTQNIKNIWDIRNNSKKFLEENIVEKGLKENHGVLLGDNITFIGNYYVGEGTKIYPGVNAGMGKDHTLFALIDGIVKYERKGRDKKQVSVYAINE